MMVNYITFIWPAAKAGSIDVGPLLGFPPEKLATLNRSAF